MGNSPFSIGYTLFSLVLYQARHSAAWFSWDGALIRFHKPLLFNS